MEAELKQRLVGASVIIALAIIFIPMIFDDSKVSKNQSISIEIPDEPNDLKHKVLNIDTAQPPKTNREIEVSNKPVKSDESIDLTIIEKPIVKTEETIIDMVDNSTKKPVKVEKLPEVVKKTVEVIKKPVAEIVKSKPNAKPVVNHSDANTYRVKFGTFSQEKNAQQLKAKIINAGFTAIVEKDEGKNAYKVHSEFLSTKKAAETISSKVQKLKLNIGKPGIEALTDEQVLNAEAMLDTGWIVQIGIFSSKENSIKLRNKIRKKGFVAFVDAIKNSKNQNLYRVRVGPYATRDEADNIKTNIKTKMNLKGLLKPHEKQKVVN